MNYSKLLAILILLFIGTSIYGQSTKAEKKVMKKAKKEMISSKVDSLVKSKDFKFVVTTILPQMMPSRQTSDGYYMSIKNDTLNCYLPYFGISTSAIYGGSDKISLVIKNQKIIIDEKEYSDKKGYIVYFDCKNDSTNETWDVAIQIFNSGSGIITCKTNSKDIISYLGSIL